MPKIFRGDFFTRMGPSVAEIFKDGFRQSGTICTWGHLCPEILIGVLVITVWRGSYVPEISWG